MIKKIKYNSSNGLHKINATLYIPKEPKAIIQLVHGMNEHMGKYNPLCKFFYAKGYLVCINDHAGHGDSYKDIQGFFADKDGHKVIVQDTNRLFNYIESKYPNLPHFLIGHSMGSIITRKLFELRGDDMAGIVLTGMPCMDSLSSFALQWTKLTSSIMPKKNTSSFKLITNIMWNLPFLFDEGNGFFLDDEATQMFVLNDKKIHFTFKHSAYRDMLYLLKDVSSDKWYKSIPKDKPILLISGEKDPITNYCQTIHNNIETLQNCGVKDVSGQIYLGYRHNILHDINKYEVFNNIEEWTNHYIRS